MAKLLLLGSLSACKPRVTLHGTFSSITPAQVECFFSPTRTEPALSSLGLTAGPSPRL